MKTSIESINSVQKRLTVTLSTEVVDQAFLEQFKKLRGRVSLQGFRKGKAPISILRKMYSREVAAEVLEQLVEKHLFTAIQESKISPIGQPLLEMDKLPQEHSEYAIVAVLDFMEPIEVNGAHKGLKVSFSRVEVGKNDVREQLEHLARAKGTVTPVEDRTVCQRGDLATVTAVVVTSDGERIPEYCLSAAEFEVGDTKGILPVVGEKLEGMTVKTSSQFDTTAPDGREVSVTVTIDGLKVLHPLAIDDSLASAFGLETLAQLTELIKADLEKSARRTNVEARRNALLAELSERLKFEVPPSITDAVIDSIIREFCAVTGADPDEALKNDDLRKSFVPEAKRRARNTIALREVIRIEGITVSDAEIVAHLEDSGEKEDEERKQHRVASALRKDKEKIREDLLFNKGVEFLEANAQITAS